MTEPEAPPSLKRLRIDDPADSSDDDTTNYPAPDTSPWQKSLKYAHRENLFGCTTNNNVADTSYFSKHMALVYQFLDIAEVIEDNAQVLHSCTFHCGVCGQGEWHWVKGGKSQGLTTNMNQHMTDWRNIIWTAAKKANDLALSWIKETGPPANSESSVLAPSEVGEAFIDVFYKKPI
ncbi:hypothetical protein FRC11_000994 [Ceratobasidium sp. 423]|nr:hypothetical protein FRC11_000994 [Ceratobasidium sp. 423]